MEVVSAADRDSIVFEDDESEMELPKYPTKKIPVVNDLKYPKEDTKVNGDLYPPVTDNPLGGNEMEQEATTMQPGHTNTNSSEDSTDKFEEEATESGEFSVNRVLIQAPKICPEGKRLDRRNRCQKVVE